MNKRAVKPIVRGYTWHGGTGLSPRITAVFEALCSQHGHGSYRHRQWLLDYSFTPFGCFRVKRNVGAWIQRAAHQAHLYAPGTAYWEDTSECGVKTTRDIHIVFSGGEQCGLTELAPPGSYARFADPEGLLGNLLSQMLSVARTMNERGFWDAQTLLCRIVAFLHRAEPAGAHTYCIHDKTMPSEYSAMVHAVRSHYQEHLSEPVTRQDLARRLNMSVSALAHKYRKETGESPMVTLMKMRINLVKGLLLKGQRLKTIAGQTGFCDAFHLSKMFKKREGFAPRQFLAKTRRPFRSA